MRVLCACEESQAVTSELRRGGSRHSLATCSRPPAGTPSGTYRPTPLRWKMDWDAVLAFPPCTHLASSGAAWFEKKRRNGQQQMGIGFFLAFTALDHVPMVAIENPVGIMSKLYRKPDQIIQPWMFGHPETKATCLWLKGLPELRPTDNVKQQMEQLPENQRMRLHYLPPSPERGRLRSKTFPGIAKAMADQWFVNPAPPDQGALF